MRQKYLVISITLFLLVFAGCMTPVEETPPELVIEDKPVQTEEPESVKIEETDSTEAVNWDFIGVWEDPETYSRITIEEIDGLPAVSSIVSDDGEVYVIKSSQWENGVLKWTYFVPSTEYTVNFAVQELDGNILWCEWSNDYTSGTEGLERVSSLEKEPNLKNRDETSGNSPINRDYIGVWEDPETHTLFTIRKKSGVLTISSIETDDGEEYELLSVQWKNGVLKWTYYVPSTGYTVNFTTQGLEGNTLWCEWSNQNTSGTEGLKRVK